MVELLVILSASGWRSHNLFFCLFCTLPLCGYKIVSAVRQSFVLVLEEILPEEALVAVSKAKGRRF